MCMQHFTAVDGRAGLLIISIVDESTYYYPNNNNDSLVTVTNQPEPKVTPSQYLF